LFISGLWHGVGWKFMVWGIYYGLLIVLYQILGVRGNWKPKNVLKQSLAWLVMSSLIVFGWLIFRANSLAWLWNALTNTPFYRNPQELTASFVLLVMIGFYASLLFVKFLLDHYLEKYTNLHAFYYVCATLMTIIFINSSSPDFIYFQF
jgi:alginate O-acetyltransferase complex protein AlgI